MTVIQTVPMSGTRTRILDEEQAWKGIVNQVLGPDAELLSVSRWVGDSRVYALGDRLAKIRSRLASVPRGVNSLEFESRVMARLGQAAQYAQTDDWEILTLSRSAGSSLERLLPTLSPTDRVRYLRRLAGSLRELHRKGVAHRDLRPDNVLVDTDGTVSLIDFDRAAMRSGWPAGIEDWIGIGPGRISPNPYWKLVLFTLVPKAQTAARRIRTRLLGVRPIPQWTQSAPDLKLLGSAWQLAQISDANAPGQGVAYYAFSYNHRHFTGERPWYLRWEAIRRAVDFEGKRVLELGCNMGLLSSFAMLHGATSATGIDADPLIVQSAKITAEALESGASFQVVDLIQDRDWESNLAGANIVIAMSLIHWLPNKERVLTFLGKHPELIYEGHDPLAVETERLRSIGFDKITVIAETERDRYVLYARKSSIVMAGGPNGRTSIREGSAS